MGLLAWEPCAVKNVGAGLLAKAVCQSMDSYLIHRLRGQARSHIGFTYNQVDRNTPLYSEEVLLW